MLSQAARVFVPWITWKSCTAAAPSTPIVISWSLFMLRFNHFVRHKISQLYCYKPHSKHWAFTVKSAQRFTSGPKIFHYTKSHKYNTCIKNHPQCATHYNWYNFDIFINPEALRIRLRPHFLTLGYYLVFICGKYVASVKDASTCVAYVAM